MVVDIATPEGPAPILGVSLEHYAGVNAAMLEGFGLPEILKSEGLDPRSWPRASAGWNGRLTAAGPSGSLQARYREAVAFAQGWLGRRVDPLDVDLQAWLGFLGAFSAHAAPFDLLEDLGLSPTDLSRVQGAWTQKIEADEALRKETIAIALKQPKAIPRVTVTRAILRPFPWSRRTVAEPGAANDIRAPFHDALGHYAALVASLDRRPDAPVQPIVAPEPPALLASLKVGAGTSLALDLPRGPTLPFVAGDAPRAVAEASVSNAPASRAPASLGGTALALDLPRGPALPFASDAPLAQTAVLPAARDPRSVRAPPPLEGTAPLLDLPLKPVLPFDPLATPSALASTPSSPNSTGPRASARLGGTAPAVEIPRGPALPFEHAEVCAPAPVLDTAPPSLPAAPRSKRNKLAELSLGLVIPRGMLPPSRSAVATEPEAKAPPLTLEQHASLCAELVFAPDQAGEILRRYQLTAEGKAALDQHYREKVGASVEVRAAWSRAYEAYGEWLARARSSGPARR
ncbi:MAG: hypothetical protein ABI193_24930 [Minicystis sp.]